MKCERCGCVILIGEACVGGGGSYRHEDPLVCIKALVIARDWSRNEARRLAAALDDARRDLAAALAALPAREPRDGNVEVPRG